MTFITVPMVERLVWVALCIAVGACNANCSGSLSGNFSTSDAQDTHASSGKSDSRAPELVSCINGELALSHVQELVSYAPRHVGSEGNQKTREYIVDVLRRYGLQPDRDVFTAFTPHPDYPSVEMENISIRFPGKSEKWLLITGHFDGKLIEKGTFYGANDSGSSTGLLLEMARCLQKYPPSQSVEVVFFDGEEAFLKWSESDSLYGSKRFVGKILESGRRDQIAAVVNVDMIGDKRLAYVREQESTPWVFSALQKSAKELGQENLFAGPAARIADDHLPFLEAKIPAANLIDFQYGPGWNSNAYWHTEQDNMKNISARSIMVTGQIVLNALPLLIQSAP